MEKGREAGELKNMSTKKKANGGIWKMKSGQRK